MDGGRWTADGGGRPLEPLVIRESWVGKPDRAMLEHNHAEVMPVLHDAGAGGMLTDTWRRLSCLTWPTVPFRLESCQHRLE